MPFLRSLDTAGGQSFYRHFVPPGLLIISSPKHTEPIFDKNSCLSDTWLDRQAILCEPHNDWFSTKCLGPTIDLLLLKMAKNVLCTGGTGKIFFQTRGYARRGVSAHLQMENLVRFQGIPTFVSYIYSIDCQMATADGAHTGGKKRGREDIGQM